MDAMDENPWRLCLYFFYFCTVILPLCKIISGSNDFDKNIFTKYWNDEKDFYLSVDSFEYIFC